MPTTSEPGDPAGRQIARYRIYGIVLASEHHFQNVLPPESEKTDADYLVVFLEGNALSSGGGGRKGSTPAGSGAPGDGPLAELYRQEDGELLRFAGTADFHLGSTTITCRMAAATDPLQAEVLLLGPVLSYLLEKRGVIALHAAAVTVAGRTAVFMSRNGGGKSTLAAAMMERGHSLLTDDILPVEGLGRGVSRETGIPADADVARSGPVPSRVL